VRNAVAIQTWAATVSGTVCGRVGRTRQPEAGRQVQTGDRVPKSESGQSTRSSWSAAIAVPECRNAQLHGNAGCRQVAGVLRANKSVTGRAVPKGASSSWCCEHHCPDECKCNQGEHDSPRNAALPTSCWKCAEGSTQSEHRAAATQQPRAPRPTAVRRQGVRVSGSRQLKQWQLLGTGSLLRDCRADTAALSQETRAPHSANYLAGGASLPPRQPSGCSQHVVLLVITGQHPCLPLCACFRALFQASQHSWQGQNGVWHVQLHVQLHSACAYFASVWCWPWRSHALTFQGVRAVRESVSKPWPGHAWLTGRHETRPCIPQPPML